MATHGKVLSTVHDDTRIGLMISICMRSISETCLVTALTDQNTIFGNGRKIPQKCQLTLQQGQEYKLPQFKMVKKRVRCNGTLTILPVYKEYPLHTHHMASS